MSLNNLNSVSELSTEEKIEISAGGPIADALSHAIKTIGSYYRGFWDGVNGKPKAV